MTAGAPDGQPRPRGRGAGRKLAALAVSAAILALLYSQTDAGALTRVLADADGWWLAFALAFVVPTTVLGAWRLSLLAPAGALGLPECLRLVLMAAALNMVLPSKMGDVAKAYAIARDRRMGGADALSLVVFEKAWDMLALLAFCVLGLFVLPDKGWLLWGLALAVTGMTAAGLLLATASRPAGALLRLAAVAAPGGIGGRLGALAVSWQATVSGFWSRPGRAAAIVGLSLLIWLLHLVQIWLFALAVGAAMPFLASLGLTPLALLVGLMPLTFAGVGTRDAALLLFYAPYMATPYAAAVGVLCTMRYLLPALAGLPFLGGWLAARRAGA